MPLVRHMELAEHIATMFRSRLRDMPQSNLRQADIPDGGEALDNPLGTAPGLRCPVGDGKVVYAVPGVPYEMQEMVRTHVIPDLLRRSGSVAAIVSRSLKTWGTSESALAEMVAHRLDALDASGDATIVLARGIEGLVVRITAKGDTGELREIVAEEERRDPGKIPAISCSVSTTRPWSTRCSRSVRGVDTRVAESVTGGLIGARIANVAGASETFRGTIGAYATDVKRSILGVTAEPVVSEEAAAQMAEGARRVLGADVGIAVTGVAGPTEQDGVAVGTVCFGIALPDGKVEAVSTRLPGDRERIRQFSTISLLNLLRQRLDVSPYGRARLRRGQVAVEDAHRDPGRPTGLEVRSADERCVVPVALSRCSSETIPNPRRSWRRSEKLTSFRAVSDLAGGAGAFPSARRGRGCGSASPKAGEVLSRPRERVAVSLAPIGFEPGARQFVRTSRRRATRPTDLMADSGARGAHVIGAAWDVDGDGL